MEDIIEFRISEREDIAIETLKNWAYKENKNWKKHELIISDNGTSSDLYKWNPRKGVEAEMTI